MKSRILLCTDLDRTLIPNGKQKESPGARKQFADFVCKDFVTLVYVTGRDKNLTAQAIDTYQLPKPDYVIADVGTTIYTILNDDWIPESEWQEKIKADWADRSNKDIRPLFTKFKTLVLQEESKQTQYKLSYYLALDCQYQSLLPELVALAKKNGYAIRIIDSIDEINNIRLVDILPQGASKRHAIEFLMRKLVFDLQNTIFAGDSGNDLQVLVSPIQSILVANASVEVQKIALDKSKLSGNEGSIFIAKGSYQGFNGNYSAGILEGINHYIPDLL